MSFSEEVQKISTFSENSEVLAERIMAKKSVVSDEYRANVKIKVNAGKSEERPVFPARSLLKGINLVKNIVAGSKIKRSPMWHR